MKLKLIIFSLISVFWRCSSTPNSDFKYNNTINNSTNNHTHSEHSENIDLNNGKKWKVDDNMIIHIRTMEQLVVEFDKTTWLDYSLLSDSLQKNIDLLTSNCTMSGKAHDELHKWLIPYIDLVDDFKTSVESKNLEKSAQQIHLLKNSFKTFNQYFE